MLAGSVNGVKYQHRQRSQRTHGLQHFKLRWGKWRARQW
jgi:hypothetical protein